MLKMDEGAKNWLIATAKKNYWRAAPWMDLDDLIQDGFWHWQIVAKKYPKAKRNHLMRLFQISYLNHLKKQVRKPEPSSVLPLESALNQTEPEACTMAVMVSQALPIVRDAMEILQTEELCGLGNQRLCKLLGVPDFDITGFIRDYFKIGYV